MVEIISSRLVPECKRRARRRSSIDSMVKALPDFIASSNGTGCDAAICSDATASTMRFFAPIIAGVGLIRRAHLQFKIAYSPVAFDLTERKISPSKIGCHSTDRAVTFDFLDSCSFFFFLFFFFTLPRGYCLESGRENRNVQQRPFANDRNAASVFLCFAPSREERTTYETTNTIVSSPRLVSNTFRYVSSPTKSGPSTRRNRVKRNESLSKFPLCRSCRCRFRTSLEIRPRNTIQSV